MKDIFLMNTDFVDDANHWEPALPWRRRDVLQAHLTCPEEFGDDGIVDRKGWRLEHLFAKQQYSTYENTPVLHKLNQSVLYYSRSTLTYKTLATCQPSYL